VIAGWIAIPAGLLQALFACDLILSVLLVAAVRVGSLLADEAAESKSSRAQLQWRALSLRRERQKI
jgi:hypothetical protein